MTRPRARPKPGRYWVVVNDDGVATDAASSRTIAEECRHFEWERIVECVPMPRVKFRRLPENEDAWEKFVVSVNGVDVIWFDFAMDAHRAARDLRRALRGK